MQPASSPPDLLQDDDEQVRLRTLIAGLGLPEAESHSILADRRPGESLGRLVHRLGVAGDDALARALAETMGLATAAADAPPLLPASLEPLNPAFVANMDVAVISLDEQTAVVGIGDPALRSVARTIGVALQRKIETVVAPLSQLERARNISDGQSKVRGLSPDLDADTDEDDSEGALRNAPVVRLVDELIQGGARAGSSDVHIEAYPDRLRVRRRIDGVLHDWRALSPRLGRMVVSRIKIMAGLDIAERRLPQDGRARIEIDGTKYDLRVATLPAAHGEGVVIRFLRDAFTNISLQHVGLEGSELAALRNALGAPFGLILITGPTGAGKSTTLAGALSERNQPGVKLISVEDPVEYQIDGVTQVAVHPAIGLSFATALRSILRNDPDIIVVGELRDRETAEMATNAALTGHLVLATLHANDAAGAVPRLVDLGVDSSLVRSTLRLALAQRLLRKLCPRCRRQLKDGTYEAVGCAQCGDTGYSGRIGVFELLDGAGPAADHIRPGCTARDFTPYTMIDGMPGLLASAMTKVRSGLTTRAEVQRVLGA